MGWLLTKEARKPSNYTPVYNGSDIDHILRQIKQSGTDLTSDYYDWVRCAFAISAEFGEIGRSMFHTVSSNHSDYDFQKTDKKYTSVLKSGNNSVKINTFFWMAKSAGLDIKTPQTRKIENIALLRRKTIGKNGGAKNEAEAKTATKEYLAKMEDIPEIESEDIINQVFNLNQKQVEDNESDESEIAQLVNYLQSLDLKKNLITQKTEFKGLDINDRTLNSIFDEL